MRSKRKLEDIYSDASSSSEDEYMSDSSQSS